MNKLYLIFSFIYNPILILFSLNRIVNLNSESLVFDYRLIPPLIFILISIVSLLRILNVNDYANSLSINNPELLDEESV